ncbi:hypothetical protein ACQEVM_02075 [Streptomyces sp. CA-243310]|uniref:hypothetical protein n=1 Tax=Streptomyces sp. CA-243310 TaxID=3240056 RepID=UPI003D8FEB29
MAENHNSQVPEGNNDPAGSTQMFRAFVEEAAPARQAGPGARQQRRAERQADSKTGTWIALGAALVLVIAVVVWVVM